jgi:prophage regulatory protein
MATPQLSDRIIRVSELTNYVGLKRSTIYSLIGQGQFPAPIKIIPGGRASGWLLSDVEAWIDARKEAV